MDNRHQNKNGAALLIALGFLAILTILIIAFAVQSRTERLSGRAFLSSARTRHLLQTSLAMAMEDIDTTAGSDYPAFFARGLQGNSSLRLADSIDFINEEIFFPVANPLIGNAYDTELDAATWETVAVGGTNPVGRIGYIIINTSGLLDANAVGGIEGRDTLGNADDYITRGAGIHPKEIQLSSKSNLIPELNASDSGFDHPGSDHPAKVTNKNLEAGLALVRNRNRAWRRFESLRDLYLLNADETVEPNIFTSPIESFSTFSYRPPEDDGRVFMGTNLTTVTERAKTIADQLQLNPAIDADFVMNQLIDYLDTDKVPVDLDFSVEAVPLINELALACSFSFTPEIVVVDGEATVVSVKIGNTYALALETWYPFTGYGNEDSYTVAIEDRPVQDGFLPEELFGELTDGDGRLSAWVGNFSVLSMYNEPGESPARFDLYTNSLSTTVGSANELVGLFEDMQTDIAFPSITCTDAGGNLVDQVEDLELPVGMAVANDLMPLIEGLSISLFDAATAVDVTNFNFVVSMECIDPRLNSDGTQTNLWVDDVGAGEGASAGSLDDFNDTAIREHSNPADDIRKVFVRNEDRIDSPWEFTYFLHDTSKPWQTIQMLAEHDPDNTRFILDALSPYAPDTKPRHGLVNPLSKHPNAIASVFLGIPTDEYNLPALNRANETQAREAAQLLMGHVALKGWPDRPSAYADGFDLDEVGRILGIDLDNRWETEAFFRNTYELFNKRDSFYTLLLAAQAGTDADGDGRIGDDEVRGTQKAVAYVWRDPQTGKAAVVFWGLADTLRSRAVGGQSWSEILQAFDPDA